MEAAALAYFSTFISGYFWFQVQKSRGHIEDMEERLKDVEFLLQANAQLSDEKVRLEEKIIAKDEQLSQLRSLRSIPFDMREQMRPEVMHILNIPDELITEDQIDRLKAYLIAQDGWIMHLEQVEVASDIVGDGRGNADDGNGDIQASSEIVLEQLLTNPYDTSVVTSPLSGDEDSTGWTAYLTQQPIE